MRYRYLLFLAMASHVLPPRTAPAQAVNGLEIGDGRTASVFNEKQPEVRVLDANGNPEYSIPIDDHAGQLVFSKTADTLYVVYTGKKGDNVLSAVDLKTRQVTKKIPIGAGYFINLLVFDDTNRLYCLTYGSAKVAAIVDYISQKSLKDEYSPTLTVIDTSTNEIAASFTWLDRFRNAMTEHRDNAFMGFGLLSPSDTKTVSVYSFAFFRGPLKTSISVFSEGSTAPVADVDVEGKPTGSLSSSDGHFEFVALANEKKTAGSLEVIDLKNGSAVTRELSDAPERLFRLGSEKNVWILEQREMRAVSESGELTDVRIPLGRVLKTLDSSDASAFVDGYPGETITLGADYAAMQVNNKYGTSRHRVALINLKKRQIEAILPTMSSAEIAGIRTDRFLSAIALTLVVPGNTVFIPNLSIRNEALAARPDGSYLYTLDTEGHEVSVFNVFDASLVTRIRVNSDITRIKVSEDDKHLICFGRKTQQIDLAKLQLED